MAITRSQQAKQMLQDGGMLVQPGFGGKRQGYRSAEAQEAQGRTGPSNTNTGNTGGKTTGPTERTSNRERGIMGFGKGPGKTTGRVGGRNPTAQFGPRQSPLYDDFGVTTRNINFINEARKKVNPLGRLTEIPGTIGFVSRAITPNPFGFGPPDMGFNDPTREDEKGDTPIWMQLGYSSEEEYLAAMAGGASPSEPADSDPPVDLNRVAYRLMADGGAVMDDEPRQAYGLGSIVKKATRAI